MPIRPKVSRCAVLGCLVNTGVQTLVSCENAIEVCESQKLDGTIVKKRRWLCLKHTGLKKMPEHPEEWFCPGCEDKGTTSHKHRPKRLRLSRTGVVPPDEFHVLVLTFMGGLLQQRLSDMYRYRGLMAIVCGVRPQEIEMYAGQDARAEKDAQCVWIENWVLCKNMNQRTQVLRMVGMTGEWEHRGGSEVMYNRINDALEKWGFTELKMPEAELCYKSPTGASKKLCWDDVTDSYELRDARCLVASQLRDARCLVASQYGNAIFEKWIASKRRLLGVDDWMSEEEAQDLKRSLCKCIWGCPACAQL